MHGMHPGRHRRGPRSEPLSRRLDRFNVFKTGSFQGGLDPREQKEVFRRQVRTVGRLGQLIDVPSVEMEPLKNSKKRKASNDENDHFLVPSPFIETECERDDLNESLGSQNEVSI